MGSVSSTLQTYRDALRQVTVQTHWREGLLVQIAGAKPLLVYKIHALDHVYSEAELTQLAVGEIIPGLDIGSQYIYQYVGDRVSGVEPASKQYAVFLRVINPAKIGGRERKVAPLEIPLDYVALHRANPSKNAADVLNIDLEHHTVRNFAALNDPYPDDNIADE